MLNDISKWMNPIVLSSKGEVKQSEISTKI